jgi:hypothetical protein
LINLDRQLYYTYNNKRYKSKWLALQAASDEGFKGYEGYSKIGVALGNHLKPFSDANWDQEPEEDWIDMCRDRLQMIRDSTPYMILSFSGGSDSLFILELALKYNIKVDEILIYRDTMISPSQYENGIHAGNYEIDKYAIPFVKNLSIKVTVTNSGINTINDYAAVTTPTHYLEDGWRLNMDITKTLSPYMNRNLKDDKSLIVRGVSEPQLYFDASLKSWYNLTYDTDNFQALMVPGSVSFFTDPNDPRIHIKQCYLLRNYLKNNNLFNVSPKNNYKSYKKAMVESTRYLNSFNTYDSLYFDKNDSKLLKNQSPMISVFSNRKTKAFFNTLKNHYTTYFNDYINIISKNKIDDIPLISYPFGVEIHKTYLRG